MKPYPIAAMIAAGAGMVWFTAGGLAAEDTLNRMIAEARKVSGQMVQRVRGDIVQEMKKSGPLRSILVCKYSSLEIAAELSRKTGWRVSRVSLKPRNPVMGTPDAWEQKVLTEFEGKVASGEKPEALEYAEIVEEPMGHYFRYMKALPVGQPCLACHGPVADMTDAVRERLATEYPFDKAVGYAIGQVRGAVTIKRPL